MKSEFEIIKSIAHSVGDRRGRGVVVGIGDDAAVLRVSARDDIVVTTDTMVEGRHFQRRWFSWNCLGRRLAAINLSDLAAMAAEPRFALLSFAVPRAVAGRAVEEIERGAAQALGRHGAVVVGGNLSATGGPLVCDMTVIGTCRRGGAWRRVARRGDAIVVAGRLGMAAAGVALLRSKPGASRRNPLVRAYTTPVPLLAVAAALRNARGVHGAIDVSDGFSSDLIHVCEASGLGCDVDGPSIPIPRAVAAFCRERRHDPLRWVQDAGEDYALILSVSPARAADVRRRILREGVPASVVGRFTPRRGVYRMIDSAGAARPIVRGGWDHFRSRTESSSL